MLSGSDSGQHKARQMPHCGNFALVWAARWLSLGHTFLFYLSLQIGLEQLEGSIMHPGTTVLIRERGVLRMPALSGLCLNSLGSKRRVADSIDRVME